jgi:cobalamin biosynthesis protein CobD/CbiB
MSFETVISNLLKGIISPVIALIIGAAVALFLYGLANYLRAGLGDEKAVQSARGTMIWGIVIIFVMVSVWGFVQVIQNLFFGNQNLTDPPTVPCFEGSNCPGKDYGGGYEESGD